MKSNIKNPAWLVRYAVIPLLCFLLAQNNIQAQSQRLNGATVGATLVGLLSFDRHFACIWSIPN